MDFGQRRDIWRSTGLVPALATVAELFARLDLAIINNQRSTVEKSFVSGISGGLRKSLLKEIGRGRAVFSNTALVQCLKEIIEFAAEDSAGVLSATDLTLCVLGMSQEQDSVDNDLLARVTNPSSTDLKKMLADFADVGADWTAQHLFDYCDPFEILAGDLDETWQRGWSPRTHPGVVKNLGRGPADVFAATYGVELDDFLALGWAIWAQVRADLVIRFGPNALVDTGMSDDVIQVFIENCSVPIDELRDAVRAERTSAVANTWMRYTLQSTPFVRLADGTFILLRLQYAVQRIFGEVLPLKLYDAIKAADPVRASQFKSAMNEIFEYRVGEALERIAALEVRFGGAQIIDDPGMKAAWSTKKGQNKKICDFAYAQRRECIVVDANNRPLPRQFAERTAAGADLENEIKENFAAGKFRQLISTIEQFRSNGWTAGSIQIDDQTKFIPFVVAPNAGMPSNEFTELLVMQHAVPMIAGFDSKILPPTIITWRDLQLLEGIAEASPGRIIELLIMWRIANYRKVTEALGLPESLSDFVDNNLTLGLVSSHAREAALACWGRLREHALRRLHEAE